MVRQKGELNRYTDADLSEFKLLIEDKLAKSTQDYNFMRAQIDDLTEAKDNEGDWMDDTSTSNEIELLSTMVHRLKKHIQDLEFALMRIKNKSYGVCTVTGELIDKRRLLAVPATTKSVVGKQHLSMGIKADCVEKKLSKERTPNKPKIISKIIRKPSAANPDTLKVEEDLYDLEDYENSFNELDLLDETSEE